MEKLNNIELNKIPTIKLWEKIKQFHCNNVFLDQIHNHTTMSDS